MIEYKERKLLNSGMCSTAYVLDGKYIQLVGKRDDSYEIYKDLKSNADLLEGKIRCVDYPKNMILIERCDEYPFGCLVYPIVKGVPLKADNLNDGNINMIVSKLIDFDEELHNSDIHWDRNQSINHEMEKVRKNIDLLRGYITEEEINFLKKYENLFSEYLNSKKKFCITHGDLWADNLIVDQNNNLTGIIDFGNMAYFLPEVDYASLWDIKEGFLDKMVKESREDITKESVNLFILHRELCFFEYVLGLGSKEISSQLEKIRMAISLLN